MSSKDQEQHLLVIDFRRLQRLLFFTTCRCPTSRYIQNNLTVAIVRSSWLLSGLFLFVFAALITELPTPARGWEKRYDARSLAYRLPPTGFEVSGSSPSRAQIPALDGSVMVASTTFRELTSMFWVDVAATWSSEVTFVGCLGGVTFAVLCLSSNCW